jgi:uncharacterized protein
MGLELDENPAHYQIKSYRPGRIQINNVIYTHSIIVSAEKLIDNWNPLSISELTRQDLAIILELSPAILLIGTGSTLEFPALDIYGDLINEGIGVEVMDTHAACHTYTVLTAENRNVVAALIVN